MSGKQPSPLDIGADLPELTPKQYAFLQGILKGETATAAYRAAYDCSKMGDRTIWIAASRERHHPKIAVWLRAARIAQLGTAVITKDSHLRALERDHELALEAGDVKAAINAEIARGKVAGLYVDRVEVTRFDPATLLAQINNLAPEVAQQLASRFGIALATDANQHQTIELTADPTSVEPRSQSAEQHDELMSGGE